MRIVLDTNILARATPGKAGPAAAVREAIRHPHVLILSPYLLTELSHVLRYDRLRRLHGMGDQQIDQFIAALQADAVLVDVSPMATTAIVPNDPEDDPIVMTALIGGAEVLCTLDRHLHQPNVVKFCAGHGVRVLDDLALLIELRSH